VETIPEKRGVSIAASAIVVPLCAAERSSPFGHLARRDGGWSAQSPSLWASIRVSVRRVVLSLSAAASLKDLFARIAEQLLTVPASSWRPLLFDKLALA
jgi:hypothetical protein